MRISYLSPGWLQDRRQRSQGGRSRSLLCLPVLAVALLVFVLPQTARAAEWSKVQIANPKFTTKDHLLAASCGFHQCFAAGFENLGGRQPLIEAGGSGEWLQQKLGASPSKEETILQAISCYHEACAAVGYYTESLTRHGFAEYTENNGGTWAVHLTPAPSASVRSELTAVSCWEAHQCTAVGKSENSAHVHSSFVVRLNGTAWLSTPMPQPTEVKEIYPGGVSCPTEGEGKKCEMAGYYENTAKTLVPFAERWNGTSWSVQTLPTPTGSGASRVNAISCTKNSPVDLCTLVGSYLNEEGVEKTLAERWNGTEWAIQASRSVEGKFAVNELYGVSCRTATECIAVGEIAGAEHPIGQAEIWNGTEWAFQKTTTPPVETEVHLRGIGCTGALLPCASAGWLHTPEVEVGGERLWGEEYR
jgi:hypothetical protein